LSAASAPALTPFVDPVLKLLPDIAPVLDTDNVAGKVPMLGKELVNVPVILRLVLTDGSETKEHAIVKIKVLFAATELKGKNAVVEI